MKPPLKNDIKTKKPSGFSTGFLFGTFLGAVGMFLFGTKAGEKLRQQLLKDTQKAKDSAQKTAKKVIATAKETGQKAKQTIDEAKLQADLALKEAETKLKAAQEIAQKAKAKLDSTKSQIQTKLKVTKIGIEPTKKRVVKKPSFKKKTFTRSGKPLK
jgi:gas vesicle protein